MQVRQSQKRRPQRPDQARGVLGGRRRLAGEIGDGFLEFPRLVAGHPIIGPPPHAREFPRQLPHRPMQLLHGRLIGGGQIGVVPGGVEDQLRALDHPNRNSQALFRLDTGGIGGNRLILPQQIGGDGTGDFPGGGVVAIIALPPVGDGQRPVSAQRRGLQMAQTMLPAAMGQNHRADQPIGRLQTRLDRRPFLIADIPAGEPWRADREHENIRRADGGLDRRIPAISGMDMGIVPKLDAEFLPENRQIAAQQCERLAIVVRIGDEPPFDGGSAGLGPLSAAAHAHHDRLSGQIMPKPGRSGKPSVIPQIPRDHPHHPC